MGKIVIDFGNIVEEMENKQLRLCWHKRINCWFVIDRQNQLYQIEKYFCGGYLETYIRKK